jgi:hypothetical protein
LFQIFSGSIPFFERDRVKKIKQQNDKKILTLQFASMIACKLAKIIIKRRKLKIFDKLKNNNHEKQNNTLPLYRRSEWFNGWFRESDYGRV